MSTAASPSPNRPWFREVWPWLLMLPPLLAVVGGVTMLVLAARTPSPLVVEDYARIEELTAERYARDREADRIGLAASLSFAPAAGRVDVSLNATGDFALPARLKLRFEHAGSAAGDRELLLERRGNRYTADAVLVPGLYRVELMPERGEWRLASGIVRAEGEIDLAPFGGG